MSEQLIEQGRFNPPQTYIRVSELAKILGWPRTTVYYWLHRCRIELVDLAGYKMVALDDRLPVLIMQLRAARDQAHQRRGTDG